jgi:hypothetical protein
MEYLLMSTYCALHINTDDQDAVKNLIIECLSEIEPGNINIQQINEWPSDFYSFKNFRIGAPTPFPSIFIIGNPINQWVTAQYNSFNELTSFSERISNKLSTRVIVVLAQSVSDAYFIQVVERGKIIRTLSFGDGNWIRNEGLPFSFETSPLGTNISKIDKPFYIFHRDETGNYCQQLGLMLWSSEKLNNCYRVQREGMPRK